MFFDFVIVKYTSNTLEDVKVDNVDDMMYARLIDMGFDDILSRNAAKLHPSDINMAIKWIIEHETDKNVESKENKTMNVLENDEMVYNVTDLERKYQKKMILNINDSLWIQKQNRLWSGTVIVLTQNKVTIEYKKGERPSLWRKTETFELNDPCLIQKEVGMSPEIERCVEISKSNGGLIKAWKKGMERPMADI